FAVFVPQPLGIQGVLDDDESAFDGERLFQEIEGPQLGGADGGLNGAVAGDHDHLGGVVHAANLLQSFQSVHARQPDVEQDDVGCMLVQVFQASFAALGNVG